MLIYILFIFFVRYLKNDTYATEPNAAAILFYTGNEGDIELFAQNTGFMWDAVSDRNNGLNAELIFAEHRSVSGSHFQLKHDNRTIIIFLNSTLFTNSPLITGKARKCKFLVN